uniref:Uncharacterized protein n=1 Tax=Helianthus annuus TaxID=4232 RepID=A0A251TNX0_HELAN
MLLMVQTSYWSPLTVRKRDSTKYCAITAAKIPWKLISSSPRSFDQSQLQFSSSRAIRFPRNRLKAVR